MSINKEKTLPPQSERTLRGRREGGTVPATLSSSSSVGLPTGLTASPVGEIAIAGKVLRVSLERLPLTLGRPPPAPRGPETGSGQILRGLRLEGSSAKGEQPKGPTTKFGRGRPAKGSLTANEETLDEIREDRETLRLEVSKLERWGRELSLSLSALVEGGACPLCRSGMRLEKQAASPSSVSASGGKSPPKRVEGREAGVQTEALPPVLPPPPPPRDVDLDSFLERVGVLIEEKVAALREDLLPKIAATGTAVPSAKSGGGGRKAKIASSLPAAEDREASSEASGPRAPSSPAGEAWSKVVGRKAARRATKPPPTTSTVPAGRRRDGKGGQKPAPPPKKKRRARLGRLPTTAAVSLTLEAGSEETLASSMALARRSIDLRAMAIDELRPRRALTGGLLLEIPGKEGAAKADKLAAEMAALLEGRGVRVGRPTKFAEVRVCGLADDATPEGVREALAKIGDCPEGDIRVGPIRMDPSGLGTAWARLPLAGARKVTAKGAVTVGWTLASVEALRQRPLRCYRCLHVGHVGQRCTSRVVRSNRCYRCSASGHLAGECPAAEPKCPLCSDLGRPAGHRLGSAGCAPRPSGGRGAAVRGQMPPHKKKAVAIPPAAAPRAKRARAGSGRGEVDGRGPASSLPPTA